LIPSEGIALREAVFKPAGLYSGTQINDAAALDYVLGALKHRRRELLIALRDAPGDDHEQVVQAWVETHHLACPIVSRALITCRRWWAAHPTWAAALRFGGVRYANLPAPGETYLRWAAQHLNECLPDPVHESVDDHRRRQAQLYRQRAALVRTRRRTTAREWEAFTTQCDWFVRVQVLSDSPSQMAVEEHPTNKRAKKNLRSQIEKGNSRIVALLGVKRRVRPHGRPRGK
jgi:hypothetical protein